MADIGNLLDSDGNLQNELLVLAFAATLLATIPILLGNEFDVNIGLRRRRRRQVAADGTAPMPETPNGVILLPSNIDPGHSITEMWGGRKRNPSKINSAVIRKSRQM